MELLGFWRRGLSKELHWDHQEGVTPPSESWHMKHKANTCCLCDHKQTPDLLSLFPCLENGKKNNEIVLGRLWRPETENLHGCVPFKWLSITWFSSLLTLHLLLREELSSAFEAPLRDGLTSVLGLFGGAHTHITSLFHEDECRLALSSCHPQSTTDFPPLGLLSGGSKTEPEGPDPCFLCPLLSWSQRGNQTLVHTLWRVCSPNIQTSLAVVKRRKLMDSGDIHLIGRRVTEAVGGPKVYESS